MVLGDLGRVAEHLVVLSVRDGDWHVLSVGSTVPIWFGGRAKGQALASLSPDCAGAVRTIAADALTSCKPEIAQTHCARDGLVQRYKLLALPLRNRWGPEIVAVYVGPDGPKYSLVDAIFRSTEEGVIALAPVQGVDSEIDFQVVDLSSGAADLLGLAVETIRWRKLGQGTHVFNTPELKRKLTRILDSGGRDSFEVSVIRNGKTLSLSVGLTSIGQLVCATLTDVSHLKRREESFRLLFDANPMPMIIFDIVGHAIRKVNDAAIRQYGYAREELIGMPVERLLPENEQDGGIGVVEKCRVSEESALNVTLVLSDQRRIDALLFGRKVPFEDADAYIVALVDITERKRSEAKAAYLAHHDVLTGLPNRACFNSDLLGRLEMQEPPSARIAMIAIDLDLFKEVNDTLGHSAGDRVLQIVAHRLRSGLTSREIVARPGGR